MMKPMMVVLLEVTWRLLRKPVNVCLFNYSLWKRLKFWWVLWIFNHFFDHLGLNMYSRKERVCHEYCSGWFRMFATPFRIVCHKLSRKLHLRSHWLHEQEAIFLWYEHKIKRQIKIIAYNSYVIVIDLELETNSDLKEIATKLSSEYWQYKGFYSFPDYFKGIYLYLHLYIKANIFQI